jgi:ankyrin repeat protein
MYSVQKGDLSMTTLLLNEEAQVDLKDRNRKNALFHAIERSSTENDDVISKLIERMQPGTLNDEDSEGKTALIRAYEKGYFKVMRQLIDAYASPNVILDAEQGINLLTDLRNF